VKSEGMSTYSAITLTPPSEISVIVQSRGKEPVPNWIFASRLHRRRSLLRRLASISVLRLLGADSFGISALYRFTEQTFESSYRDLSQSTRCFQEFFTAPARKAQSAGPMSVNSRLNAAGFGLRLRMRLMHERAR
jgi:hypothetical protein